MKMVQEILQLIRNECDTSLLVYCKSARHALAPIFFGLEFHASCVFLFLRFFVVVKVSILWTTLVYEWITRMRSSMLVSESFTSFCSPFPVWYIWTRPSASQSFRLCCHRPRAISKWPHRIKGYLRLHQWWVSASSQPSSYAFAKLISRQLICSIRNVNRILFLGLFGGHKGQEGGAHRNSITGWRLRIAVIGSTILFDIHVLSIF